MTLIFAHFPSDILQIICDHIEVADVMRLWHCGNPLLQFLQKLTQSVRNAVHSPSPYWPYIECSCLSLPPFLCNQSLKIVSTALPTKMRRLELEKLPSTLTSLKIHSFRAFDILAANIRSQPHFLGLNSILPSLLHIDIAGDGLCNALLEHLPENLETLIFSDYSFRLEDTTPLENLPHTLRVLKLHFSVNASMKPRKPLPNLTDLYLIFQVSCLGDWVSILPPTLTSLHITKADDLMNFDELPTGLKHFSYIGPFYPISRLPMGIESVQMATLIAPPPQDAAQFARGILKLCGFTVHDKSDLAHLPPSLTEIEMISTIAKPEVHQFRCNLIRLQVSMGQNAIGLIEVPLSVTHLSLKGFEHTNGYNYPNSIVLMHLIRMKMTTELIKSLPPHLTCFSLMGSSYGTISSKPMSHHLPRTLTKLLIHESHLKGLAEIQLPSSITDLRLTLRNLNHNRGNRGKDFMLPRTLLTPVATNLKILHITILLNPQNATHGAALDFDILKTCYQLEELRYRDSVPIPTKVLSILSSFPLLSSLSLEPMHHHFTFDLLPHSLTHISIRCPRDFDILTDIFQLLPPFTRHLLLDSNPRANTPPELDQIPPQLCHFAWNSETIL